MTPEEKIEFVKKMILEQVAISPAGLCRIDLFDVVDIEANFGVPDDAPILFPRSEQQLVLKKLEEDEFLKELWEIDSNSYWVETNKNYSEGGSIKTLIGKDELEANEDTGEIRLNKIIAKLNPTSKEFKTLVKLMKSKDYQATYKELLGKNPTKPNKRGLSFTIRNIKKCLGILPEKKSRNKDIIKNIKGYGYALTP